MRRWRWAATAAMTAVVATACTSQQDKALDDARYVCNAFGYPEDKTSVPMNDATSWSADQWDDAASHLNDLVNRAARAAQQDARWNLLSNAFTELQVFAEQQAILADPARGPVSHAAAQSRINQMNSPETLRVLKQECLKAVAR